MLWFIVIPFVIGILLSSAVEIGVGWLLLMLGLSLSATAWMVRRRANVWLLLALNGLLIGLVYTHLRSSISAPEEAYVMPQTAAGGQAANYRYSPPKEVGRGVQYVESCLREAPLQDAHAAVLEAMMLGDRSHLSKEQKQTFRQAGAQHLLALSGMHLGIFLTLINVLFLGSARLRISRWRWLALGVTLVVLWAYVGMVGAPKSLLRAMMMSSFFLVGMFGLRQASGSEIMADAVLLMLLVNPQSVYDIGAQLSVAAIAGLVWLYPAFLAMVPSKGKLHKRYDWYAPWRTRCFVALRWFYLACAVSLSAWLATQPLVLYYFHQIQPWQPVVSVVLVPLTSLVLYVALVLVACCLLGWTPLMAPLASVVDALMDVQDGALRLAANLPKACVETGDIAPWYVVLIYLLLVVLGIVLRNRSVRLLAWGGGVSAVILLLLFLL